MNLITIKKQLDLIATAEMAGAKFSKTGNSWRSKCPIHRGDNPTAFTVFIGKDGTQRYKCFTHQECNQYGDDIFSFIRSINNCDFKTSYRLLIGKEPAKITSHPTHAYFQDKNIDKKGCLPSGQWQAGAWSLVNRAAKDLLNTSTGELGQRYLLERGLQKSTWEAWLLGYSIVYDPKARYKRPAIVIPWFDMDAQDEIISAVKFRFISNDPNGLRYSALSGSSPTLFGLWDVMNSDKTLFLVEGELNALAIWQCRPLNTSVISMGSQSGNRKEFLQALARRYSRIIIWCDKAEATNHFQSLFFKPCEKLCSPEKSGEKLDANKLLQSHTLSNFLEHSLKLKTQINRR